MTLEQEQLKKIINDYVETLSFKWLHSQGDTVETSCRFCKDDKNFSISLTKHIYHCWNCDSSGTLYKYFRDHVKGVGFDKYKEISKHAHRQSKIDSFFNNNFEIQYKKQEVVLPDTLIYVGDAENKEEALYSDYFQYLYGRYFTRELMFKLNVHFDFTSDRIWFPSYDKLGNLNFAVSRRIKGKGYMNHGERKDIIFNEYLIDWSKPVYLFEGVFDSARVENSIPLLGMFMDESFLIFKKILLHKTPVFFILDKGKRVMKNIIKGADLIKSFNSEIPIFVGEISSEHSDVGEMPIIDVNNFKFYSYDLKYKMMQLL